MSFPISLPFFGVSCFEVFFVLGDGDVERGVVLGSVVLNFASWSRRLDEGHWYGHRWCRWCRLDDGCHVCGAATASPQEVAYTE